jgi:polyisoprenoid-binding protein YceI
MTGTTTAAPTQTSTATWKIDPAHSVAEFKVKHMMIANVKGQFSKVSGALFLDEADLANSRLEATIEASSIHTRDEQRDAHLKSPDFFDVEKYPTLHFKSSAIRIVRDGELSVDPKGPFRGGRTDATYEGPMGQHAGGNLCEHKDQPQGLRPDLERRPRDRWHSGR